MSKVIFLDVDGPMIPVRAYHLPNQTKPASVFDPIAAAMLDKLIKMSGAKLVISSTWQINGLDGVKELLSKNGIDPAHLHEDWATKSAGRSKFSSMRCNEIKWWLDDHPEVEAWVALDDEELDFEQVQFAVKASTYDGLSYRNYLEAQIYLDTPATDEEWDRIAYDIGRLKEDEAIHGARIQDQLNGGVRRANL